MADLTQLQDAVEQHEHPVEVPIFKPDGEPIMAPDGKTQCSISVLGSESKRAREADDINARRLLKAQRRKLEPSDIRRGKLEKAAALVTGFYGWEDNGQPMEFTKDNVRKLLAFDFVLEQVEAGINAHADFFGNASST